MEFIMVAIAIIIIVAGVCLGLDMYDKYDGFSHRDPGKTGR